MSELTHFDKQGRAVMVDVGDKPATKRIARASAILTMQKETLTQIKNGNVKKGDVIAIARIAGIMGAKKTPDLIPLCHPLNLTKITMEAEFLNETQLELIAQCELIGQTGVEMEALTAVSVASLTIYDMVKAIDKAVVIGPIQLLHKSGGKSGEYNSKTS